MKYLPLRIAIIAIAVLCSAKTSLALTEIPLTKKNISQQLRVGEKLTYSIKWTGIPAGTTTLEIKEVVKIDGNDCYRIICRTVSNSFISVFYPVDDVIESYVDCETFQTRRFKKYLNEGDHHRDQYSEYFPKKKEAIHYSKKKNSAYKVDSKGKTVGVTQDALSAIYFFRMFSNLKVGDRITEDVNADQKNWKLLVDVKKKTKTRLSGIGKFHSFRISPVASFEGIFIRKGKMDIWVDEDFRIALKIKVDIPIGNVVVELQEHENTPLRPIGK